MSPLHEIHLRKVNNKYGHLARFSEHVGFLQREREWPIARRQHNTSAALCGKMSAMSQTLTVLAVLALCFLCAHSENSFGDNFKVNFDAGKQCIAKLDLPADYDRLKLPRGAIKRNFNRLFNGLFNRFDNTVGHLEKSVEKSVEIQLN